MDTPTSEFIQNRYVFIIYTGGTFFRVEIKALAFPIALKEAREKYEGAEIFINEKYYYS